MLGLYWFQLQQPAHRQPPPLWSHKTQQLVVHNFDIDAGIKICTWFCLIGLELCGIELMRSNSFWIIFGFEEMGTELVAALTVSSLKVPIVSWYVDVKGHTGLHRRNIVKTMYVRCTLMSKLSSTSYTATQASKVYFLKWIIESASQSQSGATPPGVLILISLCAKIFSPSELMLIRDFERRF